MSSETVRQHVILCEGYDDRSFWKGWLLHLGCLDPSDSGSRRVLDAWGRPVEKGLYLFRTPAGSSILVQPCGSRRQVLRAARFYLEDFNHRPSRVLVNLDSDVDLAEGSGPDSWRALRDVVRNAGGEARSGEGPFEVAGVEVGGVLWRGSDRHPLEGVPSQQTLERLIAEAICRAEPERGPSVDRWLADEPVAERTIPKSYGYSYLAKWYAEHGAVDFFQALWRDEVVAAKLRELLEESGAWQKVGELVAG